MDHDGETASQPDRYARDNLLSLDSQVDPLSLICLLNCPLPLPTPDAGPDALTSDSPLPQFQLPTTHLQEQLDVSKNTVELLVKALRSEEVNMDGQSETPLAQYDVRKRLAEFKLELPALVSDPDYDCRELARNIQAYRQPDYGPEIFPPERLNIAMDEGLDFPDSAHQFTQALNYVVRHEKLDVPREAVNRLACALENDCFDNEIPQVLEETMPRRTFLRDLLITPPLSPFIQHDEHFIPETEVCEVPAAYDSSSMLSDDVKAAESAILQREHQTDVSLMLDADIPQLSPLLSQPALSHELPKISSIKMESPLLPFTTPPHTDEQPIIPALLTSMDMDNKLFHPNSLEMDVGQTENMDCTFDHNLSTFVKEIAAAAMKNIEQEQISVAGAAARMEVPTADFSIPAPEWQKLSMDFREHLKWLQRIYSIEMPLCSRNSRADSQLRWVPFLQKINLQTLTNETVDCERDLSPILSFPNIKDVPTSADYSWKRPGLAILRGLESEEDVREIKATVNTDRTIQDLASLVRKRRLENEWVETGTNSSPRSDMPVNPVALSQHRRPLQQTQIDKTNFLPGTESNLTVSTLLSNYINIRTTKRRKRNQSPFFPSSCMPGTQSQLDSDADNLRPREYDARLPDLIEQQPGKPVTLQTPCPELGTPSGPTQLIKGLSLSRGLFSRLEKLYPTAEIIERDFDRWDQLAQGQRSISGSTPVTSVAAEADVIVSAATGIIATTILKVIQRPLPGHRGLSSIRERVSCAALRYERLIILVSEGNAVDETVRSLTPSETTAYADFVCFAAGLDSRVEVFYVGGGEATLAKWLVCFAVRYAPEASEIQGQLTQDETQWEIFLRRMGFNAYAAQATLLRLKRTDNLSEKESECPIPGLASFMMMSAVEREDRFSNLIGGESVLRRVNRMLETNWS
ncbi:hypothetical protein GGS21DRAFT_543092 [Xylaria nigripes]|nr:hypothetical protein GGS21DRAFT_543092 [Xylaria nigripes]